ncbi:MAG: hypothetical protein ACERIE_06910 [Methyloceanibacter sp.]
MTADTVGAADEGEFLGLEVRGVRGAADGIFQPESRGDDDNGCKAGGDPQMPGPSRGDRALLLLWRCFLRGTAPLR